MVIAEEFDAEHRGWGIGALGALHACGAGLAALAFAFVDVLPFGWRALYAVGLVPLLLVAFLRRTLPETDRFDALARERGESPRATPPIAPASTWCGAIRGASPCSPPRYSPSRWRWARRSSSRRSSSRTCTAGARAAVAALEPSAAASSPIVGNPFAGWLSDRRGRRPVTVALHAGVVLAIVRFYTLPGALAAPFWIPMIFGFMGTQVTLAAYGAELFPTSVRSTASGAREIFKTGGAVAGLALVSLLFGVAGSNWLAIARSAPWARCRRSVC